MVRPIDHTVGDKVNGYPCPKCQTTLILIDQTGDGGAKGAWCPECKTVWREIGEIDLADLDALPTTGGDL